ncbi:MAG: recombinase family protein [Acidimicrobiales bacterium]
MPTNCGTRDSTKAAIWVRVSTDRQHEDNQIPDLERLCEHRGWEIARRYEIADASAYKGEHRHALQGMLADAHRGEFSVRSSEGGVCHWLVQ